MAVQGGAARVDNVAATCPLLVTVASVTGVQVVVGKRLVALTREKAEAVTGQERTTLVLTDTAAVDGEPGVVRDDGVHRHRRGGAVADARPC